MGDVTFSVAGLAVIGALLAALTGAIGILYRQLLVSLAAQLSSMTQERDSYKSMATDAISVLEARVNQERQIKGMSAFDVIKPVVPEHSSPVTKQQQSTADLQTLRARMAAACLELGVPLRK